MYFWKGTRNRGRSGVGGTRETVRLFGSDGGEQERDVFVLLFPADPYFIQLTARLPYLPFAHCRQSKLSWQRTSQPSIAAAEKNGPKLLHRSDLGVSQGLNDDVWGQARQGHDG